MWWYRMEASVMLSTKDKAETNLWYNQPAKYWFDGLPIANGRLGGMIYGGVRSERHDNAEFCSDK